MILARGGKVVVMVDNWPKLVQQIVAITPTGQEVRFTGKKLMVAALPETPGHWTIHEYPDNAIVGLVPKEWALRLVLE